MNIDEFAHAVPELFRDWDRDSVQPHDPRFAQLLRELRGMTSPGVLQVLNAALTALEPGEVYAEVGSFQGATLIGALLGHRHVRAQAVDNFSEFDPQRTNAKALFDNLARFGLTDQVTFADRDFEEALRSWRGRDFRVGAYLYDGAHDYRSQLLGLLLIVPVLAPRAVLVIDDFNVPAARQATWDFLATFPEARLLMDRRTPGNGHPGFWNGLGILLWESGTSNGYDWNQIREQRQHDLLQSLYALQHVSLRSKLA